MWKKIKIHFENYPAQERVARLLLEYGLSVKDSVIYSGGIKVTPSAVSKFIGCDRRVVIATLDTIGSNKKIAEFYSKLLPTCSFKGVAPLLGWGVIEIVPEDVSAPGIIAQVTGIIAEEGISLRQVIADDPELQKDPRAFVITDRPVPADLLPRIRAVKGVKAVVIY